jgi:methylase of polypeptide subunit release factors
MDQEEARRRAALQARAEVALAAALAAARSRVPIPGIVVESAMTAVKLACWDEELEPRERLLLIDDALRLLATLKSLPRAPESARPELILDLLGKTNQLLQRYSDFVRVRK